MNPFNPAFGKVPQIYLDRDEQIQTVTDSLNNPNSPYQTSIIYGMRGVGKTSFLTDASRIMAQKHNWIVVDLAMGKDMMTSLLGAIYNATDDGFKKVLETIKGINFSIMGVQFGFNSNQPTGGTQFVFEEILKKLADHNRSLLITIDEVNATPEMVELASIYQIMIRKDYRVALMMTGLPDKVSELQNNDVLTFLLRSGRVNLAPLNLYDIEFEYQQTFREGGFEISDDALDSMVKLTKGYAYAFQLLGYLVWETQDNVISENTISKVMPEYQRQLFRNAYTKIYQELSGMDRKFLFAMAKSGNNVVTIKYIREYLNKEAEYIAVYRRRLIDSQVIAASDYGEVVFTLPLFKEFVLKNNVLFG